MRNIPEFFVVGAGKCGTTSLCNYLEQHPDIFISKPKEPNFFCNDIIEPIYNIEEYLELFNEGQGKVCGEGSVWYFYSNIAPRAIYDFNSNAKIIITIKEIVDFIYSVHAQRLRNGFQSIHDFEEALKAPNNGLKIPENSQLLHSSHNLLSYQEMVNFSKYIERYFEVFDRKNIYVMIFDKFQNDTMRVYREILEFLQVNPDHEPEFKVYNSKVSIKNLRLYNFVRQPPKWLFQLGNAITPPFLHKIKREMGWNLIRTGQNLLSSQTVKPLDSKLRLQLKREFTPEVNRLSALLGQDLSYWIHD